MHRRQTSKPRAPYQPEKDSFGLVIARVAEGDDMSVETLAGALEEPVPRDARSRFDRLMVASGSSGDVFSLDENRPAEGRGEPEAELLVLLGSATQLMIEVRQTNHIQLTGRGKIAEQPRQGHGVRPTRQRDDDA
jgi:hypothetical protein